MSCCIQCTAHLFGAYALSFQSRLSVCFNSSLIQLESPLTFEPFQVIHTFTYNSHPHTGTMNIPYGILAQMYSCSFSIGTECDLLPPVHVDKCECEIEGESECDAESIGNNLWSSLFLHLSLGRLLQWDKGPPSLSTPTLLTPTHTHTHST